MLMCQYSKAGTYTPPFPQRGNRFILIILFLFVGMTRIQTSLSFWELPKSSYTTLPHLPYLSWILNIFRFSTDLLWINTWIPLPSNLFWLKGRFVLLGINEKRHTTRQQLTENAWVSKAETTWVTKQFIHRVVTGFGVVSLTSLKHFHQQIGLPKHKSLFLGMVATEKTVEADDIINTI